MIYLFTNYIDDLDISHYFYEINTGRYIMLYYQHTIFKEQRLFYHYIDDNDYISKPHKMETFSISKEESNILYMNTEIINSSYLENYMLTKIINAI